MERPGPSQVARHPLDKVHVELGQTVAGLLIDRIDEVEHLFGVRRSGVDVSQRQQMLRGPSAVGDADLVDGGTARLSDGDGQPPFTVRPLAILARLT